MRNGPAPRRCRAVGAFLPEGPDDLRSYEKAQLANPPCGLRCHAAAPAPAVVEQITRLRPSKGNVPPGRCHGRGVSRRPSRCRRPPAARPGRPCRSARRRRRAGRPSACRRPAARTRAQHADRGVVQGVRVGQPGEGERAWSGDAAWASWTRTSRARSPRVTVDDLQVAGGRGRGRRPWTEPSARRSGSAARAPAGSRPPRPARLSLRTSKAPSLKMLQFW